MRLVTALRLGRVSNLPTVWSNVLAGLALSGADPLGAATPALLLALSLFYVAGMYLNDAFDAGFDRRFRPDRPIPAGETTAPVVFASGFALLGGGLALLWIAAQPSWQTPAAGIALAGLIVLYDAWHKGNPIGPLLMGLCRFLTYIAVGCAVTSDPPVRVWVAALTALCYLIGLTYAAKQESLLRVTSVWPLAFLAAPVAWGVYAGFASPAAILPLVCLAAWVLYAVALLMRGGPAIPRAVVALIAGISLVDAVFVTASGATGAAILCIGAFALTLALQKAVAGT